MYNMSSNKKKQTEIESLIDRLCHFKYLNKPLYNIVKSLYIKSQHFILPEYIRNNYINQTYSLL